jgi:hypothetical protein
MCCQLEGIHMKLEEEAVLHIAKFLEQKRADDVANILLAPRSEHWFNAESFVALNQHANFDRFIVYGEQSYSQISDILGSLPPLESKNRPDLIAAVPKRGFLEHDARQANNPPEVETRPSETLKERLARIRVAYKKAQTALRNSWRTEWDVPFIIEAKLIYNSDLSEGSPKSLTKLREQLLIAKQSYKAGAAIGILYLVFVQGLGQGDVSTFHATITREVNGVFVAGTFKWLRKPTPLTLRNMPKKSPKTGLMKTSFPEYPRAWVNLGLAGIAIE